MINGTEACGLQARAPQDKHPPHPQCEARGNNRTEPVRVNARPRIEISHTVVRMLMHQYSSCTYWVTMLASAETPPSASQPQASQCMKSRRHSPEHTPLPEGNETPR
jgi:hypothetical protein